MNKTKIMELWNCGNMELCKYGNGKALATLVVGILAYFHISTFAHCDEVAEVTFPVEGRMLVGVNYWGSKAGIRMWREDEWDEAEIEKDIAALAANGVELMRVFPTWSEFQPLRQEKKYQGAPALLLREGGKEEIYDPFIIGHPFYYMPYAYGYARLTNLISVARKALGQNKFDEKAFYAQYLSYGPSYFNLLSDRLDQWAQAQ